MLISFFWIAVFNARQGLKKQDGELNWPLAIHAGIAAPQFME
jgi:hypothetical protein